MDREFWEKVKRIWIYEQSVQEIQHMEDALCEIEVIFTSDTGPQYSKNFLIEDD